MLRSDSRIGKVLNTWIQLINATHRLVESLGWRGFPAIYNLQSSIENSLADICSSDIAMLRNNGPEKDEKQ